VSGLPFWKTQTIGNDFVLVRLQDLEAHDLPETARRLCERKHGIGSDGLLAVAPAPWGLELRMFNPDGTEDFCGNGLRCAGWHGHLEGWVGQEFETLHGGKRIPTKVFPDGRVEVTLPPADFHPESVPVLSEGEFIERAVQGLIGTAVSTGSAHFVVLTDRLPGDEEFFGISPLVEHDPLFPEHVSVMYTQPVSDHHLKLRIWERSAGETLGCGTGSTAAAVVWARKNGIGGEVTVSNPGGDLVVKLEDWRSPVVSVSKPQRVYQGTVACPIALACGGKASLA